MIPIERDWYRRLLGVSLLLGLAGGIAALAFSGIVVGGAGYIFSTDEIGWWSGEWWWIVLTAAGGLAVALLRKAWQIPDKVPGSIELAHQAWVDPAKAGYWVAISAVSLLAGASLGPSFALIVMGGAMGSWVDKRFLQADEEETKQEFTLTGMAGSMGAAFSAPLFATILTSELSPTKKANYAAAFVPQLIAATVGFVIFFGVTGTSLLGSYELPSYEYSVGHLALGVLLGCFATLILLLFVLFVRLSNAAFVRLSNPLVTGPVGGALVGLIAFALPLTATSGSSQLAVELESATSFGATFVAAILVAKMVAVALSMASGFLGGNVFPIIFIGGTAGVLVHSLFPDVPLSLAVGAMLAAVPGAYLNAPLSLILIAGGTVRIDPEALVSVGIAVVTSRVLTAFIQRRIQGS